MPIALEIPAWCRVRRGGSGLLLVAPHGGARATARGDREVKVNDLHTAELAEELAVALDAGLIANPVLDRNELDLNRISQVARAAPWFPALLEEMVGEILARHERAEVVFLHGWNTVQPKCDIGVGHALRDADDAAVHAAALTAAPAYVTGRLAALRAACAAAGIATPLGERYPARHANNVLQLFRRTGTGSVAPRLRDWAAAGRVDAVQLELAAPLRWQGPLRDAFAAALRDTYGGAITHAATCQAASRAADDAAPAAMALQVYDPAAEIGLLARVDPMLGGVAGRLLLFLGNSRVALFTGDDRDCARLSAGGPHFTVEPNGLRLRFDGWALCAADGTLYVDLERALAASHLLGVGVDVMFVRDRGDCGRVRGSVTLDGVEHRIDAAGFAPPSGVVPAVDTGWRSHLTLRAALAGGAAVALRQRVPGDAVVEVYGGADANAVRPLRALAVTCAGEPYTPRRIVVADKGDALVAESLTRMAILRPLPGGRRMRVTFGVARVDRGGAAGFGFYEYARVVD